MPQVIQLTPKEILRPPGSLKQVFKKINQFNKKSIFSFLSQETEEIFLILRFQFDAFLTLLSIYSIPLILIRVDRAELYFQNILPLIQMPKLVYHIVCFTPILKDIQPNLSLKACKLFANLIQSSVSMLYSNSKLMTTCF